MKKAIAFAALLTGLGACATSVPTYTAAAGPNRVGYLSSPGDANNRYAVVYTGAKGFPRDQVARLALLRAADLTVERGEEWFAVIATSTERVEVFTGDEGDLTSRGALDNGNASTATGGAPSDSPGDNVSPTLGPSTGGFGGGDVPYQVIERWTPPKGYQTTLIIQMGSGDEASFPGLTETPQIFPAAQTAQEIRTELGLAAS